MADLTEHIEGGVATLTLNRPDSLNALSDPMITALLEALDRLGRDPAVGAIVLAASGRAFCAGGDVKAMATPDPRSPQEKLDWVRWGPRAARPGQLSQGHHRQHPGRGHGSGPGHGAVL